MLILPFLFLFHFSNAEFAEVSTPYGRVQGSLRNTSKMTPFYSFQGLPFAAPPVGNLRLLPPQPPISWDTPLDLTGILSINFQISYLVTKFYLLVIYLCMNIYFFLISRWQWHTLSPADKYSIWRSYWTRRLSLLEYLYSSRFKSGRNLISSSSCLDLWWRFHYWKCQNNRLWSWKMVRSRNFGGCYEL